MKWVTRSHVHVDRVACPWLITRFIDSEAEFIFVPRQDVARVVAECGAIPFDVPGCELGHHAGRCSFEAIIRKYELKDRALLRMAKVINAADTDQLDRDPLAPGLEAIAAGFSLRFPDDKENIQRQFPLYDALYTWCRMHVRRSR
ncbi:chromate resistance protein [bacterium]|nr:chromate resistance protein [bacterium]